MLSTLLQIKVNLRRGLAGMWRRWWNALMMLSGLVQLVFRWRGERTLPDCRPIQFFFLRIIREAFFFGFLWFCASGVDADLDWCDAWEGNLDLQQNLETCWEGEAKSSWRRKKIFVFLVWLGIFVMRSGGNFFFYLFCNLLSNCDVGVCSFWFWLSEHVL